MKPERALTAERAVAQHCAELVRHGPGPGELLAGLARSGERFGKAFATALAQFLGSEEEPEVTVRPPHELDHGELAGELGSLCASSLFACGIAETNVLASIEGSGLLRLVDRAFGGKGEPPGSLPVAFPLSAELMITRLETLIAASLGQALGHGDPGLIRVLRRDPDLGELAPFPTGTRLALLRLEVMEGARAPWRITLAVPVASLHKLIGPAGTGAPQAARAPRTADPSAEPFAEVPLELFATLVDMTVPLSAVSALEPGAVLPVTVARLVPLTIGATTIARGTLGAQDEHIAIKLTQLA